MPASLEVSRARIDRPELTERLRASLERGSVMLVADAGFGKTTALEQTLADRGGHAVWLRAAPSDRDPGRLLSRLVEAIRAELPGVADEYAERLAAAMEPLDVDAVARSLVDDLDRLLVDPLVVAIDDAERLARTPALAILRVLLDGRVIRVALCSRRPLGMKLARLKATGRAVEFGPADLAFSPSECEACLRLARGQEPSSADVEALFATTEGWPLGVALAAAAGQGSVQLPAGGREAIFEYLAEEVLDGVDQELQQRLLDASIVDELDSDLEHALGLPDGFDRQIESAGVFVRRFGASYAVHPLLRDFLRTRLAQERSVGERCDLHKRVADAHAARAQMPDAIEHWLAAGAFDSAAGAIGVHGILLAGTAPETVRGWVDRLPGELRSQPMLRLLAGRLAVGEGDFGLAVEHCRAGVSGLEHEGVHEALLWSARLALTDAYIAALDLEAAAEASAGADASLEGGPAAVFCALAHAAVLARIGAEESDAALDAALGLPRGQELLGPGLAAFKAHYRDLPAWDLDDALAHVEQGVLALEATDAFNRLPYVFAFKMAIHEARGELEQALATFDATLAAAQRSGLAGYVGAGARLAAATIFALLDRPEEAKAQLQRVDRDWSSWAGCDKHVARALLAARERDAALSVAEGERALDEAERMPPFDRIRPTAVIAPVLCGAGRPEIAKAALESLLKALGPGESKARTRTALACVLHHAGDEAAGHAALAAALEEAGPAGRFVLRSEWPQVEPALWSALEAGALDPETGVATLAAAFPGGPEVVALMDHPEPAVREAALSAAAAAGRPEALAGLTAERVERLKRDPPALEFRTLGGFEIRRGLYAVEPARWERKVAERVVRFLLIRGGEVVAEDELLEAFWPEKPPGSARRGLQTAISSARAVLDLPWEETRIHAQERAYSLTLRDGDRLDAGAFEATARRALEAAGPERVASLEAAARLWTGEPMPEERYSDWATGWRERLSSLHGDLLGALADAHSRAGDHAAAARAARALVDLDPLDEHAHRLLMRAYAAAGRRAAALRQFLECRRALVDELGIEPGAETLALHRRILAGA